jgi:Putative Flp pilus-assembly TadE/G-like
MTPRRIVLRFLHSSAGNIAIISALLIPVIVGFCGLAAETSYWYYRHRNVQDAADLAAYGAAVTLSRDGDEADVSAAAKADAITNGWREGSGTIEVTQDGPRVEVLLIENQTRYFTRLICGTPTIRIGARAVAFGPKGGKPRLVWVDEEENSPGRLSTGCSKVQAVSVKTDRRKARVE